MKRFQMRSMSDGPLIAVAVPRRQCFSFLDTNVVAALMTMMYSAQRYLSCPCICCCDVWTGDKALVVPYVDILSREPTKVISPHRLSQLPSLAFLITAADTLRRLQAVVLVAAVTYKTATLGDK